MKNIIFIEVGGENFCCYQSPMILNLENQGLTVITGPNGIGKTTALDLIPYSLYGITSKGLRGDDVVNDKVGKNCKTWLKFRIDNINYEVVRYVKHYKNGNTAHLYRETELIKKGHVEVKSEIERLLISQKLFFNTLLFGQKIKSFFTELTDSEQKEIFRNIISLNKYEIYKKYTDNKITELEKKLTQENYNIDFNTNLLNQSKEDILKLEKSKVDFYESKKNSCIQYKNIINEYLNQLKILEDQKNKLGTIDSLDTSKINEEISNLKNTLSLYQNEKTSFKLEILNRKQIKKTELEKQAEIKKSELTNSEYGKIDIIKSLLTEERINKTNKINEFNNKLESLEKSRTNLFKEFENINFEIQSINKYALSSESICPTCKQKLSNNETLQIFKEKEKLLKIKLKEIKEESNIIPERYSKVEDEKQIFLIETNKRIKELEDSLLDIQNEIKNQTNIVEKNLSDLLNTLESLASNEIQSRNNELDFKINKIQSEINIKSKLKDEIESKLKIIKNIDTDINSINNNIKINTSLLQEKENQVFDDSIIDNYKLKVKSLQSKISSNEKNIIETNIVLKVYQFWKESFSSSGIPSMLIDESIPFMNRRVHYYLDKLSSGRFNMSFDTMKENKSGEFRDKISINIVDNKTHADSRTKLSGGQTRLVDIATILTLYDLQSYIQDITFNIMVFDEIFDSLDDENIKYASNVLKSLIVNKSVFIISHRHITDLDATNELNMWN